MIHHIIGFDINAGFFVQSFHHMKDTEWHALPCVLSNSQVFGNGNYFPHPLTGQIDAAKDTSHLPDVNRANFQLCPGGALIIYL